MSEFVEIRLPHGTKYVTVEEIPRLIADALHPQSLQNEPTLLNVVHADVRWENTERQQRDHLRKAIHAAQLQAYNSGSTPLPPTEGTMPHARILVDDFSRYVERDIRVARVSVESSYAIGSDEPDFSHLVDTHVSNSLELDDEARQDDYGEDTFIRAQESPGTTTSAVSRQRWQENEILRVIAKLDYRALDLPKNVPGKKGVRDEVYTRCAAENQSSWIGSVFEKAWARLSTQKRIRYSA